MAALKKLYMSSGYTNFDVIPDTVIDDHTHEITLTMDLQEGKQYRIRTIAVKGLSGDRKTKVLDQVQSWIGRLMDEDAFSEFVSNEIRQQNDDVQTEYDVKIDYQTASADIILEFKPKTCPEVPTSSSN